MNKYTYYVQFLTKDLSPTGTKVFSIVGSESCKIKDMKGYFENYLKSNSLTQKGTGKTGTLYNVQGKAVASYDLTGSKAG